MAAGKPIVAVAPMETDVASLGVKQGFGIATDPDRPEELVAAVRALTRDSARVRTMGLAARAAAGDYERENELAKFASIFNKK